MPFSQQSDIRYFHFNIFPASVTQAIFTRQGGVSPSPWDSLNVGGAIGDETERVRENRIRSFRALGREPDSIFDVWQVHSADVVYAHTPRSLESPYQKADVILTDNPQVTLFMRFADCVPILLHDPVQGVVGLVHSGWLGTVRGAARAAVEAMGSHYDSNPGDILAAIGPSIGPDHYEVGEEVVVQVKEKFGEKSGAVLKPHGHRLHFDLWEGNRLSLVEAGVKHIEIAQLCTACHEADWYSHRAQKGKTGRFGALIAL